MTDTCTLYLLVKCLFLFLSFFVITLPYSGEIKLYIQYYGFYVTKTNDVHGTNFPFKFSNGTERAMHTLDRYTDPGNI